MAYQKPIEIKEVQIADFIKIPERSWVKCNSCNSEVFRDANGRTSYHKLGCKKDTNVYYKHPSWAQRG